MKNLTLFIFILFSFLLTARAQQELTDSQKQQIQSENILLNGGFEAGKTSWTSGAGTVTSSTTAIKGKRSISVSLSSQTLNVYQDSTLYASQYAGSVQGLAYARVKTTLSTVKVCARQAGATSSTLCVTHSGSGNWELLKVPFVLSSTSNGIAISTSSSATGTVLIDDAFVGAVDLKVDTNNISDWVSGSCASSFTTNTTTTCQYRRIGDSIEVQYLLSFSGAPNSPATPTVDLPSGFTPNFSKIVSEPYVSIGRGTISQSGTYYSLSPYLNTSTGKIHINITTTSAGTNPVNVQASSPISTTSPVTIASGAKILLFGITVPISGLGSSGSIYSSTNADTSLAEYTPTFNSGFTVGTGGNASSKFWWYRDGQYMVISGGWRLGSSGASIGTGNHSITIPSGYSIDTSKLTLLDGYPNVGTVRIGDFSAGAERVASILVFNSSSNTLFIGNGANFNGITSTTPWTWAQDDFLSIEEIRVPIVGWENSNIIIGQFNGLESCTNTFQCTDTFSAYVNSSGTVSSENVDWISGNASISTQYILNLNTSNLGLTTGMNCQATADNVGRAVRTFSTGASQVQMTVFNTNTQVAVSDTGFTITCQKQGTDYIGKTAKAVASDQNVRSVGSVGVDIQSVYFGSSADCSTACTTGSCTICNRVGTKITSVSFSSTGQYDLNGIDGTKYNCVSNAVVPGSGPAMAFHDRPSSSSTAARVRYTTNALAATNVGNTSVTCIGIP